MIECNVLSVNGILKNISFSLNNGEITVIIGKNGCGKTTLLRCLSGSAEYTGEVKINKKNVKYYTKKELSQLLAVMPQNIPAPDITLKKLVSFGRQPYTGFSGRLSESDTVLVDSIIKTVGLSDISNRALPLLSGGERRLSYFAMLLAQTTPIIFCDEPTANLDPEHQKAILQLISDQRSQGKTVVCVLHDINQALEIADRVLVLDKGELIFNGKDLAGLPVSHFGLKEYICDNKKLYL